MTKDPVCGMRIAEASAAAKAEYKGTTYFCSAACKTAFEVRRSTRRRSERAVYSCAAGSAGFFSRCSELLHAVHERAARDVPGTPRRVSDSSCAFQCG